MKAPQTLEEIKSYLENVQQRYAPTESFSFGYEGEMCNGGEVVYPHVFMEAELMADEVNPGMDGYTAALWFLDLPDRPGTTPGTYSQPEITANTKQWGDEFVEILRMEQMLGTVTVAGKLSAYPVGNDGACGWRFEVSFSAMKQIDRAEIKQRLTPMA